MLCHVPLVRTDISEEHSVSIIKVTRIGKLGTTLAVTSTLEALHSSETSVLTRATWHNIPEDAILHFISFCHPKDIFGFSVFNISMHITYYVTNRKVAGSRPDEVIDFHQFT
jgi:hypothetical protein